MSGFSESAFQGKLAVLTESASSVKNLSGWLASYRKHYDGIVKIWYKEFLEAQEHRKLLFVYLANDLIQNSRRKGDEFVKLFAPILKKTFDQMAKLPAEKTKISTLRVLQIWKVRRIFDVNFIQDLESSYLKTWNGLHGHEAEAELQELLNDVDGVQKICQEPSASKDKSKIGQQRRDKRPGSSSVEEVPHCHKRARSEEQEIETTSRNRSIEATNIHEERDVDGVAQVEVEMSLAPYKESATEDDRIQMINDFEEMPSAAAETVTRGEIADLPPEVSDISGVDKTCVDADASRKLQDKIRVLVDLLRDYNKKLDMEVEERKKALMKAQTFMQVQEPLLTHTEQKIKEYQNNVKILRKKFEDMEGTRVLHESLPSAEDSFNVTV